MNVKTHEQLTALWAECETKRRLVVDNLENGNKLNGAFESIRVNYNQIIIDVYDQFQDSLEKIINTNANVN